jgi:hypothetical protein
MRRAIQEADSSQTVFRANMELRAREALVDSRMLARQSHIRSRDKTQRLVEWSSRIGRSKRNLIDVVLFAPLEDRIHDKASQSLPSMRLLGIDIRNVSPASQSTATWDRKQLAKINASSRYNAPIFYYQPPEVLVRLQQLPNMRFRGTANLFALISGNFPHVEKHEPAMRGDHFGIVARRKTDFKVPAHDSSIAQP